MDRLQPFALRMPLGKPFPSVARNAQLGVFEQLQRKAIAPFAFHWRIAQPEFASLSAGKQQRFTVSVAVEKYGSGTAARGDEIHWFCAEIRLHDIAHADIRQGREIVHPSEAASKI